MLKNYKRIKYHTMNVIAYYLANGIDIKKFKEEFAGRLFSSSPTELFYTLENDGFLYIFSYGAVVFANMDEVKISSLISHVRNYCQNPINMTIFDDYFIKEHREVFPKFDFNEVYIDSITPEVVKIVMFNLAQSVSLDYYGHVADELMGSVNDFTSQLENTGRINFSKKNMLKFVGKTLSTKNRIIDDLYIFDVPDTVWDDKVLDRIHSGLVRTFDLRARFKEVEASYKTIEENLSIFMDIYQHRMSNILEWIIIFLILIEVVDLFLTRFRGLF